MFQVQKASKFCKNIQSFNVQLKPGKQVCVTCQEAAMRKHLDYRCIGHGVTNLSTRWTMLSVPNCHGKWIKKGQYGQCPCHGNGHSDFIFV